MPSLLTCVGILTESDCAKETHLIGIKWIGALAKKMVCKSKCLGRISADRHTTRWITTNHKIDHCWILVNVTKMLSIVYGCSEKIVSPRLRPCNGKALRMLNYGERETLIISKI